MGSTLDLNQASESEIQTLPGISRDQAAQIVDFRFLYGTISDIDELGNLPGFENQVLESLKIQAHL